MTKISRIGIDTSKSVFVLHGVDGADQPVLRKKLRRKQMVEFFARFEPTRIGLEACRCNTGQRTFFVIIGCIARNTDRSHHLAARIPDQDAAGRPRKL